MKAPRRLAEEFRLDHRGRERREIEGEEALAEVLGEALARDLEGNGACQSDRQGDQLSLILQ